MLSTRYHVKAGDYDFGNEVTYLDEGVYSLHYAGGAQYLPHDDTPLVGYKLKLGDVEVHCTKTEISYYETEGRIRPA